MLTFREAVVKQHSVKPLRFDWYQNHRPWMTLNDLERPKRTVLQKRCVFWSPLHKFELNRRTQTDGQTLK